MTILSGETVKESEWMVGKMDSYLLLVHLAEYLCCVVHLIALI